MPAATAAKRSAEDQPVERKKQKSLPADEYRRLHEIVSESELPDPIQRFKDAPFDEEIVQMLKSRFPAPTPVQAQTWAVAMLGRDLVGVARTGSGKTLAFLLPAMHRTSGKGVKVLTLAPTRELAVQIEASCASLGDADVCGCVYGGVPKDPQVKALKRRVLVATPGRLVDFLEEGKAKLGKVEVLVLDEADRMLDMGFEPQLTRIMQDVPEERQTLFFTATWPKGIAKLATKILRSDAIKVRVQVSEELTANTDISQEFFKLDDSEKPAKLWEILDKFGDGDRGIVFCNTKRRCEQLVKEVWASGYNAVAVHGDKQQKDRDRAVADFIAGKSPVMFATDVAARGLDIKGVTHVLNYDMAADVENYVHRIGRTGRAGSKGTSITFVNEDYDIPCSPALVKLAQEAGVEVPAWLTKFAEKAAGQKKNKRWQY